MAAKRAHTPAAGRLPNADGAIARATGRELSVRAEPHCPQLAGMPHEDNQTLTAARVPHSHAAILVSGGYRVAVHTQCHPTAERHAPAKQVELLAACSIP